MRLMVHESATEQRPRREPRPARPCAGLAAALLIVAAPPEVLAGQRTSITGELVSGPRRGEVVLERIDRQRHEDREIARADLTGGVVSFEFIQTVPALYRLRLPRNRWLEVALRPGQRLVFEYDPGSGAFASTGSADTEQLQAGVALDRARARELAAPAERHSAVSAKEDAAAMARVRRAKEAWFAARVELMAALESPLAVYGLFTRYDWNREIGDLDLAGIEAVHRRLADADPESVAVELLADVIRRYRETALGAVLPDAVLKDPDGRIVRLSDLLGRHVLVVMWASGCRPCRRDSARFLRSYEKYRDEGFTLYSISFDHARDRWLKAIKKDGLDWPYHVSDLKGRRSEAGYVYATAPPSNFLVGPEGRVLAKNLHGEALERELGAIYGY